MGLVAKMRVASVTKTYREGCGADAGTMVETMELKLFAVTDPANKEWSTATPAGDVRLLVGNKEAFPLIESLPGKHVLVHIDAVD